jgi:hypothetical protein
MGMKTDSDYWTDWQMGCQTEMLTGYLRVNCWVNPRGWMRVRMRVSPKESPKDCYWVRNWGCPMARNWDYLTGMMMGYRTGY